MVVGDGPECFGSGGCETCLFVADDCCVLVWCVDDGDVVVGEFGDLFWCGQLFCEEDVFVGDVEDWLVGFDVVDELVVFVVGDVACVSVHDCVSFL